MGEGRTKAGRLCLYWVHRRHVCGAGAGLCSTVGRGGRGQGTGVGGVGLDGEAVVGWARLRRLLVSVLSLSSDVVESSLCCSTSCWGEVVVLVEFGREYAVGLVLMASGDLRPVPKTFLQWPRELGRSGYNKTRDG